VKKGRVWGKSNKATVFSQLRRRTTCIGYGLFGSEGQLEETQGITLSLGNAQKARLREQAGYLQEGINDERVIFQESKEEKWGYPEGKIFSRGRNKGGGNNPKVQSPAKGKTSTHK